MGAVEAMDQADAEQVLVEAAVDQAVNSNRSGAPAEVALKPVRDLMGRSPRLPRLAAAAQTVSPRTLGYTFITALYVAVETPEAKRPSRDLALAAAQAWDAELTSLGNDPVVPVELDRLTQAYVDLDQRARARRVVDLDRTGDPIRRIRLLTTAQAWREAAEFAAKTTTDQVAAVLILEAEIERREDIARFTPTEARLAKVYPAFAAGPDKGRMREDAANWLRDARANLASAARIHADAATAADVDLDVCLVSYGEPSPSMLALESAFS